MFRKRKQVPRKLGGCRQQQARNAAAAAANALPESKTAEYLVTLILRMCLIDICMSYSIVILNVFCNCLIEWCCVALSYSMESYR